ncbi:MAG TPA: hypothetical protein VFA46_06810 [Actinomycetes bacterium]|nr:hypothetical protein [Actinomycetes bacterium]
MATGASTRPLAPPSSRAATVRESGPAPADLAVLRGNLLYTGGRQPLVIDPSRGTITSMMPPGAGRILVLRQGGFIVLLARDGQVAVQPANGASRSRPIGQASEVLPSLHPDRVWLVSREAVAPDRTFVLREMDLPTGRLLRRWSLPYDAEPVAMVPQGVVVRDLHNDFLVRDPSGRHAPLRLGFDLTFLDVHGSLLAYLVEGRLHLRDLAGGRDRVVAAPAGARSWFALGPPLPGTGCCLQFGAFSPDGSRLAVFTELATPASPGLTVVDVATGRASLVQGSAGATPVACQPCLGWSRSGWLFFFNGGPGAADLAAWRPGVRAVIPLALDLRSATTVLPSGLAAA